MPKEKAALALTNGVGGDSVGSGKSVTVDSSRPIEIICTSAMGERT